MRYWLRSSSHEPDFRDLALPLNLLWNSRCVHMKGGAGLVPKMLVSVLEILLYEHFIPITGIKAGWILVVWMALSFIACCILHIISIPLNCRDTALGVAEAMIGLKVKFFVFRHVCFVSPIWCQISSPGSLAFSHLGNQPEISHMNPRWNSSQ